MPVFERYRAHQPFDLIHLKRALLYAAYWRPHDPLPDLSLGLQRADLAQWLEGWGRPGDTAVLAQQQERIIGAAWFRLWTLQNHSYGFVAPEIPELGIGIQPGERRRGIGTALIRILLEEASLQDFQKVSLSVENDNGAIRLYEQEGFQVQSRESQASTMLIDVSQRNQYRET